MLASKRCWRNEISASALNVKVEIQTSAYKWRKYLCLSEVAKCLVIISVAIEADHSSYQMYSSEVRGGNCGTSLDHVVLIAVLGTLSGTDYWKVKTQGDPADVSPNMS